MVFTPHLVVCFCIWVCSLHNFYPFYFQGVNEWRQQSEESTRRSKDSSWEDEDTVENDIWEFGSIEISPIRNGSLETREEIVELKIVLSAESFIFFLLGRDALEWHSSWKLNSVIIVTGSAIFDGKVSTAFELSFCSCFQIMERFISSLKRSSTWLIDILPVWYFQFLLRVFWQCRV